MNSKIKGVIIAGAVLVLLVGAVLVLSFTGKPAESDSSSSVTDTQAKLIYEKKREDIASVSITNKIGGIEITKAGDGYEVDGLNDLPIRAESLEALLDSVAKVSVKKTIEDGASDLAKYGLTTPTATVKVSFSDSGATVKEFILGDNSTTSGQSYFAFKGEDTVYAVATDAFDPIVGSKLALLETTLIPMPPAGVDNSVIYPLVDEISVTRGDTDYTTTLTYDKFLGDPIVDTEGADTSHVMSSPVKAELDFEAATPLIRGMFGLTGAAVIAHPTPEELAKAGITDGSFAVVSATIEGQKHSLIIGKSLPAEGEFAAGYLCYYDGLDVLLRVDTAALPWITTNAIDVVSSFVYIPNIFDVAKVELVTATGTTTFDLSGKDDTFAVKMNGKEMTADYFKKFYQYLLMAPPEEFQLTEPTATTPDVKLTYTLKNGEVHTLEFFNTDSRRSIIAFDGATAFQCRISYVERLLSNMELLPTEGEIIDSY